MKNNIFVIVLFVIILTGCKAPQKLSLFDMSDKYNFKYFTYFPSKVYNVNDSISEILLVVNLNDMTYEKPEEKEINYANYSIHYDLFFTFSDNNILDSATIIYVDSTHYNMIYEELKKINIRTVKGNNYIVRLELNDLNSKQRSVSYIPINKIDDFTSQNFLIQEADGFPIFNTYLNQDDYFRLKTHPDIPELYVRYYQRDFPLSLPPFMVEEGQTFNYNADSTFLIPVNDGKTPLINFEDVGFYHFQADAMNRNGITLFNFYQGFPELNLAEHMLEPLKYITKSKEFTEMQSEDDKKIAVDKFWLNNAGNPMRAKTMIKKFYNRVVYANMFFTSYLEGWKTDRGLIYIVFGPPRTVYFSDAYEEWIYGEEGHSNSIRFQFYKVENPFSDNDYNLLKSPAFKEKWYEAVSLWRR